MEPLKPAAEETRKKRHRSPSYPTVGLREAIDRVKKFYKADGKAGAPPELAAVHIGFATPHGQAYSVLSALKKFGLVAESGGRIVPTQRAIEIINLPASDVRRERALKEAAMEPHIYKELIEQHKETGWPQNDVLERELITYRNFNPNSVAGFVQDLKDTLEFSGLSDLSALDSEEEGESETDGSSEWVRPRVGDLVQWESQGILKLPSPKRVAALSDDGSHAFLEGSMTGVPISELIIEERPAAPAQAAQLPAAMMSESGKSARYMLGAPAVAGSDFQRDVWNLEEGPVTIQWPKLTAAESYESLFDWLETLKRKLKREAKKAGIEVGIDG